MQKLSLKWDQGPPGQTPSFEFGESQQETVRVLRIPQPVCLDTWRAGAPKQEIAEHTAAYSAVKQTENGFLCEAELDAGGSRFRIADEWLQAEDDTWQVNRKLTVLQGAGASGFRLRLDVVTALQEETDFTDLKYFAPPALYDKNDLDEDGLEDYLGARNLMYREDRLNMLAVLAYDEKRRIGMSLLRADRPAWDDVPDRPDKERLFLQKTDIGSLGVWKAPVDGNQMSLRASYPFYEGERCHALYMKERPDWGSFWPAETGEAFEVSYGIRVESAPLFIDAVWQTYTRRMKDLESTPVPLPATAEKLNEYRLEALDRYFIEKSEEEDSNKPAGYALNCHPQNGVQLSNIIQFGFTGQNILSAYNSLRFGLDNGVPNYVEKAQKVVDFFVEKAHLPETGMFYNLYSVEKKSFDFWWTGLLLPLAYAEGERLRELMGPLYEHREFVIKALREKQGSYLRCMNEDVHALLLIYRFEQSQGRENKEWLEAAKRYAEFLLRTQETDGTWYRAYDIGGKAITDPPIWFGTTVYEQKSSTATSIPLLIELYEITGDERYLEAAEKAGRFVRETIVKGIKFNGGIHDSIYAKGQLIDNESIYFPMIGLLALYKATKDPYFLQGAHDAAKLNASWTVLWDVPLPPQSTLAKFDFRSTGIGACDTPGAGYVHPFELSGVAEMVEIAVLTVDQDMLRVAELLWHGCNQTVATPEKDWGYAYTGLQEEGYLISWWAWDDPMFGDTGFGQRWKGEGNKTCFPWIPAVAVHCYWKLYDMFGTADFNAIREQISARQGVAN
ncbi:hypothetical protein BG53_04545 [Paenibacillus darwinianus]|uniref:Uncharacterized protein n=1 Tax=Paenibacillus darwinianus TaxID=1380763 RepID=A0A9W5S0H8_9BACL|nr:hypothetical protein [Paenibacillus darwinianus]EXX84955.1 hypothetical protein CH50_10485 [Paenibacillus darwinianus]EXX86099.1 hypothetical protein BG52_07105 [Paenibacillus darwinianus]EXX87259.1 hypothetical protein BG53_04545 [Paenibacillus darwinianus]